MAVILSERVEVARGARLPLQRSVEREARWHFLAAAFGRAGRSIGQIALFALFGILGVLMNALVLPVYSVLVRDPVRRVTGVRNIVRRVLRGYVGCMQALRLIDLEISGLERVPVPGTLFVANHPSLIDALILLSRIEGAVVVAKRALQINAFIGISIRAADYIVTTDAAALVDECGARIAAGESLVLFPECTRTAEGGAIRLRRGAAQIAVRSKCPMVPVTIDFSEPLLTKRSRWWLAPRMRPSIRVVRHQPIDPLQFMHGHGSVTLGARRLTEHLQALYTRELARRGPA